MGAHGRDGGRQARCGLGGGGMAWWAEPNPFPTLGFATMASTPLAFLLTIITVAAISVMTIFLMIDMETLVLIHQIF